MFVYIMDGFEAMLIFLGNCHVIKDFGLPGLRH